MHLHAVYDEQIVNGGHRDSLYLAIEEQHVSLCNGQLGDLMDDDVG